MSIIGEVFGTMVFNDEVMRQKLPKDAYKGLRQTIETGKPLNIDIANAVAHAMKEWAVELGATHFTHWFQPMTGITAEKHDSFLNYVGEGKVILRFSGKELIKGESDASSFPSGGLRATFEARGYTAWDPTSYAFIKDRTLYIPTAFCSYDGSALDKKTPLLRSMQALEKQALRILRLFDNNEDVTRVFPMVGPEQEYFLIDKEYYKKRPDLVFCGRTLFGARPPKGQELADHYYGSINARVRAFMHEIDIELWKLGIPCKTKHNEVAPAQHELAPVFEICNIATDHNQLIMEVLKTVAAKHNLVCLLNEKPFNGVNGSGKHNNWSLNTNTGVNLFEPGETPYQNAQFILFLSAVIKAVDDYAELMRISVADAGNDHRLGAHEAPPAIISIFLGDELSAILDAIESGASYNSKKKNNIELGVTVLPPFPKDTSDRNRTSPFAFTGNKFEFRMLGSSASVADCNIVLNVILAQTLCEFADKLENKDDFNKELNALVKDVIKKHRRVLFNGNNYSDEWVLEANRRGLSNLKTLVDALPHFLDKKCKDIFINHRVFNEAEFYSRYEIMLDNYCRTVLIEAHTLYGMAKKQILSAAFDYQSKLGVLINQKTAAGEDVQTERAVLAKISRLAGEIYARIHSLDDCLKSVKGISDSYERAKFYRDSIAPEMDSMRKAIDGLEEMCDLGYPDYAAILYSVT